MATEAEILSSSLNLVNTFRQANQRILALENRVRQSPDVAREIGSDVVNARNQYSDLLSQFTQVYVGITGGPLPDGLQVLPIVTLAAWAAILATVAYGIYALVQYIGVLETRAQTAQTSANTQASLVSQAAAADAAATDANARGDYATAQQQAALAAQLRGAAAGAGASPSDFGQWVQDNWIGLAIAAAAVLTVPKLVEG